jgi:hypothetical protein
MKVLLSGALAALLAFAALSTYAVSAPFDTPTWNEDKDKDKDKEQDKKDG